MMWFLVEMIPVWLGCMLSMQVIRYAFGGVLGLSDEATMRSYCRLLYQQQVGTTMHAVLFYPFRALIVLTILEVIRKQRRDMTYLVNIVRHHLLVDEAVAGGSSDVCFGPPCDDQTHADVPWLLRKVQAPRVSLEGEDKLTQLEVHLRGVELQWRQLQVGTGAISEIADKETDLFYR